MGEFWCPQCGQGAKSDEDGCCAQCGSTLITETVYALIFMLGHERGYDKGHRAGLERAAGIADEPGWYLAFGESAPKAIAAAIRKEVNRG